MNTEAQVKQVVANLLPRLDAVLAAAEYRRVTKIDCAAGPAAGELGEAEPEAITLQVVFSFVPKNSDVQLVLA